MIFSFLNCNIPENWDPIQQYLKTLNHGKSLCQRCWFPQNGSNARNEGNQQQGGWTVTMNAPLEVQVRGRSARRKSLSSKRQQ